jgi:hypothetical protein
MHPSAAAVVVGADTILIIARLSIAMSICRIRAIASYVIAVAM